MIVTLVYKDNCEYVTDFCIIPKYSTIMNSVNFPSIALILCTAKNYYLQICSRTITATITTKLYPTSRVGHMDQITS